MGSLSALERGVGSSSAPEGGMGSLSALGVAEPARPPLARLSAAPSPSASSYVAGFYFPPPAGGGGSLSFASAMGHKAAA